MKRIAIFCILSLTSVFADVKIGTLATKGWVGGQITSSQNSTDEKIALINNRIDTIEYASRPNMNIVGSPIFVQGSVSGFSANDYMVFPSKVSVGTNTVEFYMGFTTGSDVTTRQNILDSNCGLAFAISNGYTITSISYDGSTFVNSRSSANTVSANTSYWLKLLFRKSGGNYFSETFLGTSRDNMTQRGSGIQTGLPLVAKPTYWGGANPQTGVHHIFNGTINLGECSLYFNGKEVWSGYDTIPNNYVSFDPNAPSVLNTAEKIVDAAGGLIRADNPEFASAVRDVPPNNDGDWGEWGTIGAVIAVLRAAVAALKRTITAIADTVNVNNRFLVGGPRGNANADMPTTAAIQTRESEDAEWADEVRLDKGYDAVEGTEMVKLDKSVQTVTVNGGTLAVVFPEGVDGTVRDLCLYVNNTDSTTECALTFPNGTYYGADGWDSAAQKGGITGYYFSEIPGNGWRVAREELKQFSKGA